MNGDNNVAGKFQGEASFAARRRSLIGQHYKLALLRHLEYCVRIGDFENDQLGDVLQMLKNLCRIIWGQCVKTEQPQGSGQDRRSSFAALACYRLEAYGLKELRQLAKVLLFRGVTTDVERLQHYDS